MVHFRQKLFINHKKIMRSPHCRSRSRMPRPRLRTRTASSRGRRRRTSRRCRPRSVFGTTLRFFKFFLLYAERNSPEGERLPGRARSAVAGRPWGEFGRSTYPQERQAVAVPMGPVPMDGSNATAAFDPREASTSLELAHRQVLFGLQQKCDLPW